jgi:hypothetical protein
MGHSAGRSPRQAFDGRGFFRRAQQDQALQQSLDLHRAGDDHAGRLTQVDTLGSYVDLEVLNHYVWMEFGKVSGILMNTVYYFVGEGMDEMLLLAPPDFPLLKGNLTRAAFRTVCSRQRLAAGVTLKHHQVIISIRGSVGR